MGIEEKLAELGVTLPEATAPLANYVPFVKTGALVHVSGQISVGPDGMIIG
ncbi:MAG: RidA family protein, partial [Pseudomonadota bacterium]